MTCQFDGDNQPTPLVKSKWSPIASPRQSPWLWLISVPILLIVVAGAFFGYLSIAKIDTTWAVGTSKWATPPGTTIAGRDIGRKNIEEINSTISSVQEEFSSVRLWLVEHPSGLSITDGRGSISPVGDEVAVSIAASEFGLSIDTAAMRKDLEALDETSQGFWTVGSRVRLWNQPPNIPIRLALDQSRAHQKLERIKSGIDRAPQNAKMDFANHSIRPSRDGVSLDVDQTVGGVPKQIAKLEDIPVKLVVNRASPGVVGEDLNDIDIEHPLATYTTSFSPGKVNRSKNIEMVSAQCEEAAIEPGATFSFNRVTGPRTAAGGYLPAPMYVGIKVELSPGGGACQVSTTLYNAALLAGLEIVERHPHGRPCSYVPYGQDAATAYDAGVDLKFKNTLAHAIILHQTVDMHAGKVTFEIFGNPADRVKVVIHNAYSWIARPGSLDTYINDTSLAAGQEVVEDEGCPGISQRAWRVWFDEAGNEVRTEQLSSDHVSPIGRVVRRNPSGAATQPGAGSGQQGSGSERPKPEEPTGVF